jgi:hypothetical protein
VAELTADALGRAVAKRSRFSRASRMQSNTSAHWNSSKSRLNHPSQEGFLAFCEGVLDDIEHLNHSRWPS